MTPCDSNVNCFCPMESIKLEFQSITPQGEIIRIIFHFEFSFSIPCYISPKLHEKLEPLSNYAFAWEKREMQGFNFRKKIYWAIELVTSAQDKLRFMFVFGLSEHFPGKSLSSDMLCVVSQCRVPRHDDVNTPSVRLPILNQF